MGFPINPWIGSMLTVHGSEWEGSPELRRVGRNGEECFGILVPIPVLITTYLLICLKRERESGIH